MAIKLEKILTVSARDWCSANAKNLTDYVLIGVNIQRRAGNIFNFVDEVPEVAKVVTDFREAIGMGVGGIFGATENHIYAASGTALVPKIMYVEQE